MQRDFDSTHTLSARRYVAVWVIAGSWVVSRNLAHDLKPQESKLVAQEVQLNRTLHLNEDKIYAKGESI